MKTELQYLLLTALLTGVLWIPVVIGYVLERGLPMPEGHGTAATAAPPRWIGRAHRAQLNAVENFAPFAAVVLIAQAMGVSNALTEDCAAVSFFARLAHAVLHITGLGHILARALAFTAGWMAFMVYAVALWMHRTG